MKCSVCGTESNADARFCSNCGTKLNPGAETLFNVLAGAHPTAAAPPESPESGTAAPIASPRTKPVGLLVALAAVAVVGYFAYRVLTPGASPPEDAATEPPPRTAPSPQAMQPGTVASPSATEPAREPAPVPPREPAIGTAAEPPAAAPKAQAAPRPRAPSRTAAPQRPAPSAATAPPAIAVPAPEPTPPAPPAAPPKPNRITQLNDALARCAGQNLISRAVCEQRARLQHCEGYWGQVPQCPGGRSNFQTN